MSLFSCWSSSFKTWNRISNSMNHQRYEKRYMSYNRNRLVNLVFDGYEQSKYNGVAYKYEESFFSYSVNPVFLTGRGEVEADAIFNCLASSLGPWKTKERIKTILRNYEKNGVTGVKMKRTWFSISLEPFQLKDDHHLKAANISLPICTEFMKACWGSEARTVIVGWNSTVHR